MLGYMGKILRVNLTDNDMRCQSLDKRVMRKFIGGIGLGAKILFEELKAGIDPLGPENKLVIATGLIGGIPVAGNSRYVIMAKSPLTGILGEASAGGFFGSELKFSGFDAIVVEGKTERPVYLWIHNGEAEIRDANALWGRTTGETQKMIQKEVGDDKARVACIGQAGENLVKYACVISDFDRAAGRTGMGAVFGSKKLKAIVVRGTKKPRYADEERLMELVKEANQVVFEGPLHEGNFLHLYGTAGSVEDLHATGRLPTKNFAKCMFEGYDRITGKTMADTILVGTRTCYACPVACRRVVEAKEPYVVDRTYGGPEYETVAAMGSLLMNDNLVAISKANELCNKMGLDTISTGVTIAFAMECYENGLIGREDVAGLDLTWGNHNSIIQLIKMIGMREGIGNILAQGVTEAAKEIGRGAERFAIQIKGQEVPMHEPRGKKGLGLSYAISNRGACHNQASHDDSFEDRKQLCPEIGIDDSLIGLGLTNTGKEKVRLVKIAEDLWSFYNCLIVCLFTVYPEGGIGVSEVAEIVAAATGWDVTVMELMTVGERAFNLCRAFNVREGITRKDDVLPQRLMGPLPDGPYKRETISKEILNNMLDYYYEFRGWDKMRGIPTEKKLDELALSFAVTDLYQ